MRVEHVSYQWERLLSLTSSLQSLGREMHYLGKSRSETGTRMTSTGGTKAIAADSHGVPWHMESSVSSRRTAP